MTNLRELEENLDPEEARALVDPALQPMVQAVRRYDGYVVQSTGDGILALFGAPVTHEDHPQRALYAALRMQQELRRYSAKLREQGTHQELLAQRGIYHRLYQLQYKDQELRHSFEPAENEAGASLPGND